MRFGGFPGFNGFLFENAQPPSRVVMECDAVFIAVRYLIALRLKLYQVRILIQFVKLVTLIAKQVARNIAEAPCGY